MNKEEIIKFANDQLIGQGNLDVVDEVFSTDYITHVGEKEYKGHDFIKRWAKQVRSAIQDVRVVNVELLVQEGNTIAWQRTFSGTHKSDMMGIPASGKKVEWVEMVVTRFEGKKIAEEWVVSELAGELLLKLPKTKENK